MRQKRINEHGFSLIELFTVIVIIGVLAAMASLGFEFVRKEQVASATRTLLSDLQRARMEALTMRGSATAGRENVRGAGINITSLNSYSMFLFNDNATVPPNYSYDGAAEATNVRTITLSRNVELTINGVAPVNVIVIFDRFGIPRMPNMSTLWFNTLVLRHRSLGTSYQKCISVVETRIREGNYVGGTCNEL